MKTVSILKYDQDTHQFYPSFVIEDDFGDSDNECAFDETVLTPSREWMDEYLEWNRFGRLPDDPAEDSILSFLDFHENDPAASIPVFHSLQELHYFNAKGDELARRLQVELEEHNPTKCAIRVAPYQPLYTNMVVGPVAAWWHLKDCNYGFVVPVQRLPVSDNLKSRMQAYRFLKGTCWQDPELMRDLVEEGRSLQRDVTLELAAAASDGSYNASLAVDASVTTVVDQQATGESPRDASSPRDVKTVLCDKAELFNEYTSRGVALQQQAALPSKILAT